MSMTGQLYRVPPSRLPELMSEHKVYPDIWDEEDRDALFDYVWERYEHMVCFYLQAAAHGDGMLLHVA